jgi:hypothetical protein
VTSVDRRQAGVRLSLRFRVESYPSEAVISRIKALLLLSPYRAAGSSVTAEHDAERGEIEVGMRIPRSAAQDAARKEISLKIPPLLSIPGASEERSER